MKKIINNPRDYTDEALEGIVYAYGDKVKFLDGEKRVIVNAHETKEGKVGIVTGGGFGHLPLFLGYVGDGMVDACVVGNVFASPPYSKMEAAIRAVDKGAGVLCLYGNYGGDKMNFRQAMEDCEFDDIKCVEVLGTDDVASAPAEKKEARRGVAGIVYAYKCAGAAANRMMSLEEVAQVARDVGSNLRTMGMASTSCIVPEVGKETFSIADDTIEIGMGIHGEKGITSCGIMSADELTDTLVNTILDDMSVSDGDEVSVMVNGLGGTPLEEQFIVYRRIYQLLTEKGITIVAPHIGEFATSMEMAGISISILKLNALLKDLLLDEATTPFYRV